MKTETKNPGTAFKATVLMNKKMERILSMKVVECPRHLELKKYKDKKYKDKKYKELIYSK